MKRQESMTNTNINNKKDPQKKYRLGTVSKILIKATLTYDKPCTLNNCTLKHSKSARVIWFTNKLAQQQRKARISKASLYEV